jgi:hypothetical protein
MFCWHNKQSDDHKKQVVSNAWTGENLRIGLPMGATLYVAAERLGIRKHGLRESGGRTYSSGSRVWQVALLCAPTCDSLRDQDRVARCRPPHIASAHFCYATAALTDNCGAFLKLHATMLIRARKPRRGP